jgi:ribosomal protein S27E
MSSNWWAQRIGNQSPTPSPMPPVAPPQPMPYNPVPQPEQAPTMPQSAMAASRCPGCGSGNYGSADPAVKARCYDCGYPVVQSGSGMGKGVTGGQASGPATPARQINTANNFNPQGIIGRIE